MKTKQQLQQEYKHALVQIWSKHHILPDVTLEFLYQRQTRDGYAKAYTYLREEIMKTIQLTDYTASLSRKQKEKIRRDVVIDIKRITKIK